MNLEFSSIADAGNLNAERIALKAKANFDLTRYAIFAGTSTSDGRVAGGNIPYAFWFWSKNVSPGDFVVVYSKSGSTSEKKNSDGTTSHFFYWGLSSPIWQPNRIPVIVETSSWAFGAAIKRTGVA
jgi:hypothetical protein